MDLSGKNNFLVLSPEMFRNTSVSKTEKLFFYGESLFGSLWKKNNFFFFFQFCLLTLFNIILFIFLKCSNIIFLVFIY